MCGAPWRDKGPSALRADPPPALSRTPSSRRSSDARRSGAMKGQQKAAETEEGTVQIQEGEEGAGGFLSEGGVQGSRGGPAAGSPPRYGPPPATFPPQGAVATGEDPTSVAIASIQSAATFPDPNIKYVFRTENGGTQVMYRVIQVADGQLDGQTEGTSAISGYPAAQSMTQAVIQGAFTSEDAVETEAAATETHYTYFPTAAVADSGTSAGAGTTATAVVTTQNSEALLGQPTPTGQFFVMMSPQEVLQGGAQRSIAPRAHPYSPKAEAPRATRDEKRRAQHNEEQRGDPVQGLRLHPGAAAEQPPPVRGAAGPGPAPDGQRGLAAAGRGAEEQEPDPAHAAAAARRGDRHQERQPLTQGGPAATGSPPAAASRAPKRLPAPPPPGVT
uniref:Upstream transcription factor 1 n=1 Tax=Anas platyrhynchos TaxID=8839 RepID=A0A8B9QY08_ANAPL